MSRDPQKALARRRFAEAEKIRIVESLHEYEWAMWREAAKRAKEQGLYAQSTYDGDAALGLRSHAGIPGGVIGAFKRLTGWWG